MLRGIQIKVFALDECGSKTVGRCGRLFQAIASTAALIRPLHVGLSGFEYMGGAMPAKLDPSVACFKGSEVCSNGSRD